MGSKSKHLSTETHQYQNSNTETMNSMIMSSRKALVAKPTQSRRVASKATRRPVAMAGMQVLKPEKRYECLFLPAPSFRRRDLQADRLPRRQRMGSMHRVRQPGGARHQPALLRRPCSLREQVLDHRSSPCSDASPEMRFSPRSRTARTSTQDTGSGLSDSTTSGSARWPASSAGSKQDLS